MTDRRRTGTRRKRYARTNHLDRTVQMVARTRTVRVTVVTVTNHTLGHIRVRVRAVTQVSTRARRESVRV